MTPIGLVCSNEPNRTQTDITKGYDMREQEQKKRKKRNDTQGVPRGTPLHSAPALPSCGTTLQGWGGVPKPPQKDKPMESSTVKIVRLKVS
jgi:hypothetical protein